MGLLNPQRTGLVDGFVFRVCLALSDWELG